MKFREVHARGELAAWVDKLWLLDVSANELDEFERCAPDGAVEIMVHLGTPLVEARAGRDWVEHPRSLVVGHMVKHVLLEPRGSLRIAAARLRPSAVGPIFRLPAHELIGQTLAAEDLLGEPGRLLFDRVASAEDPLLRLAEAIHDFARGVRPSELASRAEREIIDAGGQIRLSSLARALGATQRSLQRTFRDQLGLSPKRFAILRRFQKTCSQLRRSPHPPLVDIALSCGYADQPHFTREFSSLIGVPPSKWLGKERRLHRLLNSAVAPDTGNRSPQ